MSQELEKRLEQLGIDSKTFQELEEEFKRVIEELSGDASMERFRREFEKLHKALKESHEREKEHLKRCRRLNDSLVQEAVGVDSAIKITQEDENKIKSYQAEVEHAQKHIRLLKEKEEKNEATIKELNAAMNLLADKLKSSNNLATGKSNEINELTSKKEDLENKIRELEEEEDGLKNETEGLKSSIESETEKLKKMKEDIVIVRNSIESNNKDNTRAESEKNKQSEKIEELKIKMKTTIEDKQRAEDNRKQLKAKLTKMDRDIQEKKHQKSNLDSAIQQLHKDEHEYRRKENDAVSIARKLQSQENEKTIEYNRLKQTVQRSEEEYEKENRECNRRMLEAIEVEKEKEECSEKRDMVKKILYELEREIDEHNRIIQEDNKIVIDHTREQNAIRDTLSKAKKINEEQDNERQKVIKEQQKLKRDAEAVKKEIFKLDGRIMNLKIEKDKKSDEANQANSKYDHLLDEIKLKDNMIAELQKKNLETEAKLKQQQSLYEAVRSDRSIYAKKLTETQEEITDIKRKYRTIMYQISQLKEEINMKDIALNNEYSNANDLKKNCISLENQNKQIDQGMKERDKNIDDFSNEIAKLQFIIKESEAQRVKLKEQYDMIVSERDILGTQLIRRNEELNLLYEKIKIQQSTLAKGEHQYKEKLTAIEVLKETMKDLMRQLKMFKKKVQDIPDLKKNVHSLHKELIEEKLKVKALSEELENPMNVHRWRKLEGTESEAYEMITKMHTLHK